MSIVDKVIASVTLPESEQTRTDARMQANEAATPGDWLAQILDQHLKIDQSFAAVKAAIDPAERLAELKQLSILLNGHSLAEEVVIYPIMSAEGEKGHAALAYNDHVLGKIEMGALETLEPLGQDFIDKLEHIEGGIRHHMYLEEGNWLLDLKKKVSTGQDEMLTERYAEEFNRYVGEDALGLT